MRQPTRDDLARTLLAYGAFNSAGKIMEGNDRATLAHLRKLRDKLKDERGKAVARVIRNLEKLVAAEEGSHDEA